MLLDKSHLKKIDHPKFKYELVKPVIIDIDINASYYEGYYLSITERELCIYAGFKWDGSTIIHDGKKDSSGIPLNWVESCVHDALIDESVYSGGKTDRLPLSRGQIDGVFRDLLSRGGRWYRNLWYHAVRGYRHVVNLFRGV